MRRVVHPEATAAIGFLPGFGAGAKLIREAMSETAHSPRMRAPRPSATPLLASAILVTALAGAGLGCAAQSENFDDRDWTKEHGVQSGAWREVETLFDASETDVDAFRGTMRGVRHDLTMKGEAQPTTRCNCLDVAVGTPADGRFAWADVQPIVNAESIVVAVRHDGSVCSSGGRPSIQAVDVVGQDVVVVIEELPDQRPQALGAVVPKPGPKGRLWVRPRRYKGKTIPYGRTASQTRCLVETDLQKHHQTIGSGRRF